MPRKKVTEEPLIKYSVYPPRSLYEEILQERDKLDPYKLLNIGIGNVTIELCKEALLDRKARDRFTGATVATVNQVILTLSDLFCDHCSVERQWCQDCAVFKAIKSIEVAPQDES